MTLRSLAAALGQVGVAIVVSSLTIVWLLAVSPGRLSGPGGETAGLTELLRSGVGSAWQDGRPVPGLVAPALAVTAARVGPALGVAIGVALALARREGRLAGRVRRGAEGVSILPVFLLGYLVIPGLNRAVATAVGWGLPAPPWFALPIGDGAPHAVRWGLEVLVLGIGDGVLGMAVGRLRREAMEISSRPYVLAAEVNGCGGGPVVRRHLRAPTMRLAAALLPLLLGGAIVVETLFQEPGAGRLLVDRLEARDFPVVGAILAAGILVSVTAQAVANAVRERA